MNIRPSPVICQNYNEITDMCRKTEEKNCLLSKKTEWQEETDAYLDDVIAEA